MKKLLFLIYMSIASAGFAAGQDSVRVKKWGVENNFVFSEPEEPWTMFTGTYTIGSHQIFGGIAFDFVDFVDADYNMPYFIAGYRILPNPLEKRFNFFFDYTAEIVPYKYTFETSCNPSPYPLDIRKTSSKGARIYNIIGIGFHLTLYRQLYLTSGAGYTVSYEYGSTHKEYCDGSTVDYNNNYWDLFRGPTVKLGLGIYFVKRKKKTAR